MTHVETKHGHGRDRRLFTWGASAHATSSPVALVKENAHQLAQHETQSQAHTCTDLQRAAPAGSSTCHPCCHQHNPKSVALHSPHFRERNWGHELGNVAHFCALHLTPCVYGRLYACKCQHERLQHNQCDARNAPTSQPQPNPNRTNPNQAEPNHTTPHHTTPR